MFINIEEITPRYVIRRIHISFRLARESVFGGKVLFTHLYT